jgi:prepilin-type N-terminal cleavage/methylation domain-containing protein
LKERIRLRAGRCSPVGFSLIELIVVLAVLTAIAGLVVPLIGQPGVDVDGDGQRESAKRIATLTSMNRIHQAIVGGPERQGLRADLLGIGDSAWLNLRTEDLFSDSPPQWVIDAGGAADTWDQFDPITNRGWRGPYLLSPSGRYSGDPAYGSSGAPAVLDGWGRPIIVQVPTPSSGTDAQRRRNMRLVSFGVDGVPQTLPTELEVGDVGLTNTPSDSDDVVINLWSSP